MIQIMNLLVWLMKMEILPMQVHFWQMNLQCVTLDCFAQDGMD